jgi:hypothetical protein
MDLRDTAGSDDSDFARGHSTSEGRLAKPRNGSPKRLSRKAAQGETAARTLGGRPSCALTSLGWGAGSAPPRSGLQIGLPKNFRNTHRNISRGAPTVNGEGLPETRQ